MGGIAISGRGNVLDSYNKLAIANVSNLWPSGTIEWRKGNAYSQEASQILQDMRPAYPPRMVVLHQAKNET